MCETVLHSQMKSFKTKRSVITRCVFDELPTIIQLMYFRLPFFAPLQLQTSSLTFLRKYNHKTLETKKHQNINVNINITAQTNKETLRTRLFDTKNTGTLQYIS